MERRQRILKRGNSGRVVVRGAASEDCDGGRDGGGGEMLVELAGFE